jgi:hypothetical protein
MSSEFIPSGEVPFSPEEVQRLRQDDIYAARHLVYLMVGIFALGLVGYSLVALWVA